jgi:hypothetical protein
MDRVRPVSDVVRDLVEGAAVAAERLNQQVGAPSRAGGS